MYLSGRPDLTLFTDDVDDKPVVQHHEFHPPDEVEPEPEVPEPEAESEADTQESETQREDSAIKSPPQSEAEPSAVHDSGLLALDLDGVEAEDTAATEGDGDTGLPSMMLPQDSIMDEEDLEQSPAEEAKKRAEKAKTPVVVEKPRYIPTVPFGHCSTPDTLLVKQCLHTQTQSVSQKICAAPAGSATTRVRMHRPRPDVGVVELSVMNSSGISPYLEPERAADNLAGLAGE
ncbi:hypothetical protein KIPB_006796, partial [Kipferlia bialata]|eukprot:g6796.t1